MGDQQENTNTDRELKKLVAFKVGEREEYAIPILKIQEIIKMVDITRVPNSPPYVAGVINLRGKVMPVIDLAKRMALEEKGMSGDARIMVVDGGSGMVGFVVHSVSEVMTINESEIKDSPSDTSNDNGSQYTDGIGNVEGRLVSLLNIGKILSTGNRGRNN